MDALGIKTSFCLAWKKKKKATIGPDPGKTAKCIPLCMLETPQSVPLTQLVLGRKRYKQSEVGNQCDFDGIVNKAEYFFSPVKVVLDTYLRERGS